MSPKGAALEKNKTSALMPGPEAQWGGECLAMPVLVLDTPWEGSVPHFYSAWGEI